MSATKSSARTSAGQWSSHATFVDYAAAYEGDACLMWPFWCGPSGHGVATIAGKCYLASRAVALKKHGPPPEPGMHAAHECNNPGCCNGKHISWKTPQQNVDDREAAGRTARGERGGTAVLTEDDVRLVRASDLSGPALAAHLGVRKQTIYKIRNRQIWRHVA